MKISYNWIKEYIEVKKPPEGLADILTNSGSEVKAIERAGDDFIMDVEITPNRSDCLNYIGIAREVSALTGKAIKMPPLKIKRQKPLGKVPFSVDIKDKDLCPRYTARLMRGVKVGESPGWLKKKIASMGLRPVNNIVDITNYVLFELGQPMHAFDYDKIKGKTIVVRRARQGEKIKSIDNKERSLEKDMLVIADQQRPVAIGGVMGGLDTEVTEKTKNILLESAYFDPVSIRRTSFKLALISESSYRFERGIDPGMVLAASDRTALLIEDICGGKICEIVDKGRRQEKEITVFLRINRLNEILNLGLKENYVKKILSGLLLKNSSAKKGVIRVSIPSSRPDIKCEIDLVEEVARIHGFENIAMTIPKIVPNPDRKSVSLMAREKAKGVLASLGLNEVITYTMTGRGNIQKVFGPDIPNIINVKNYLSFDQESMRPSLIGGVLSALVYNMFRGIKDIKVFEIGAVYSKDPAAGYSERANLCIALTGLFSNDWQRKRGNVTFFDLKGIIETLGEKLGIKNFEFEPASYPFLERGKSCKILLDNTAIGKAGLLSAGVQNNFDITQEVYIAEMDLDGLTPFVNFSKSFIEIAKYPSIKRDISLIAKEGISFASIAAIVAEEGKGFIKKVELMEKYEGEHIPAGHRGIAFRIEYRDKYKTLTAEGVGNIHSAIRQSLVEKLGVTLR